MENTSDNLLNNFLPGDSKQQNLLNNTIMNHTEVNFITPYDKNSLTSQSEHKAEELFSSFTANIIKEETLFIR